MLAWLPDYAWWLDVSAWVIPVVSAIILHEIAHGWVAEKLGDPTARHLGRITLNPLKHIDHVGTILFPAFLIFIHSPVVFGAARPVPVNFANLRPPRRGMALVALAGPATNVCLAIIAGLLLHIEAFITPEKAPWLFENLYRAIMVNCVLACFNMIPLLPLDGGRVVASMLPTSLQRGWMRFERLGILLLIIALIVPSYLGFDLLQTVLLPPTNQLLQGIMWLTRNGG